MALKTDPPNPDKGGGEPSPRPTQAPRLSPRDAKSVGGKGAAPAVPQAGIHPSVQPKAPTPAKGKETTPDLFSFAEVVAEPVVPPAPKSEPEPVPEPKAQTPAPAAPAPAPAPEPKPKPKQAAAAVPPAAPEEEVVFIPGPPRPQPQAQPQPKVEAKAEVKAEAKAEARTESKIELPKQPSVQPPPEKPAMATPTPQHIDDFRRNAERQKKEQQSFGNVLATVTYSILVAFILATGLAGYGGYILFKKIELQRMTLAELDRRYEAEVVGLKEDLARSHAETAKLGDVVTAQQEQIARLRAAIDKVNAEQFRNYSALKAQVDQLEAQSRPGIH